MYFQALHWSLTLSLSIISTGYNGNKAIFTLFEHNFVELWLSVHDKHEHDRQCKGRRPIPVAVPSSICQDARPNARPHPRRLAHPSYYAGNEPPVHGQPQQLAKLARSMASQLLGRLDPA